MQFKIVKLRSSNNRETRQERDKTLEPSDVSLGKLVGLCDGSRGLILLLVLPSIFPLLALSEVRDQLKQWKTQWQVVGDSSGTRHQIWSRFR